MTPYRQRDGIGTLIVIALAFGLAFVLDQLSRGWTP